MRIEATVENLDKVLEFIEQKLDEYGASMKVTTELAIAAEEIFVNIAHYAFEDVGFADITMEIIEDIAKITFMDSGRPYNPLEKEDPDITLSIEERQIGGLGIYMVKKSMDKVSYEFKDGKNILTIEKILK